MAGLSSSPTLTQFFQANQASLGSGAADTVKKAAGASTMFDPLTGGLMLASAGVSLLGGINSSNTAANVARRQEAAAWEQSKLNYQAQQEAAKWQTAGNMAAREAQFGWGADLDLGRQIDAEMLNTGLFGERKQALMNRDKIFNQALANSPDARLKARFDNELSLQRTLAERMGAMQGMFGQIQPINISTMFS